MDYEEFVALRKAGKISAGICNDAAFKLIDFMEKPQRAAILFWSWIAFLAIPISIVLAIFWKWWAIFLFLSTFAIHKANKKTAAEFILNEIDKNKELFNFLVAKNLLEFRQEEK